MEYVKDIVIDEIENNMYTRQVRDLFNLMYADSIYTELRAMLKDSSMHRLLLEQKINVYMSYLIANIDEDVILERWIQELNRSSIPNSIINIYLWEYTSSQFRSEQLKTSEWKKKICSIVLSMIKYEKRFST